ncbi:MAG: hypothetical protein QGG74_03005 [Phycisphaerales bacterium]|nr:hypothetical protein [Phycisphaerales bacterium]
MTNTEDPDQLVTITTATSEFVAHILVAILDDAGIDAFSFGSTGTTLGVTGQSTNPRWGVPIQVRRRDIDAAKATLQANRRDSVDIDWDMVDVGTSAEEGAPHHGPPLAARVAWLVAAAVMVLGLILAVVVLTSG